MSLKWSTLLCRVTAVRYMRGRNALCGYEIYGIDRRKEENRLNSAFHEHCNRRMLAAYDQWAYKVVPATMEAVTYYKLT